jgi:multiple antibiotic resistance protein
VTNFVLAGEFIGATIIAILVISNPLSTSAVFIALTDGMKYDEKMPIIKRSLKYSAGILVFFAITGLLFFRIFGFSVGAFRIAGGVLLFTTAIGMLNPKPSEKAADATSQDIALIPLSIPFTAGPGTIVTVVILMSEAQNISDNYGFSTGLLTMLGVFIGITVVIIVSYMMMSRSEFIDARLKEGGRNVVTKIMGLVVMAIAIQFFINGIKDILPEFVEVINGTASIVTIFI